LSRRGVATGGSFAVGSRQVRVISGLPLRDDVIGGDERTFPDVLDDQIFVDGQRNAWRQEVTSNGFCW